MQTYVNVALIILSVVLILAVLLQAKGGTTLGSIFGGPGTVFRTKRGIEKTLFQLTIVFAILFLIISLVVLRFA